MTAVPFLFGIIGLYTILVKKDLIGVISGLLILFWGASLGFVLPSKKIENFDSAQAATLFLVVSAVFYVVLGYALCVRLFYSKDSVDLTQFEDYKE